MIYGIGNENFFSKHWQLNKQVTHLNNRKEENIPSIILDKDDVAAYRGSKSHSDSINKSNNVAPPLPQAKAKTSGLLIFTSVLIYLVVGVGAWWFHQEGVKTKALLASSEARIAELENQLSATGEEMGESTIALKAKLEGIIKKTDTLWSEMDKLWASAWRKNQAEIKALYTQNETQADINDKNKFSLNEVSSLIKETQENQKISELNISALSENMDSINQLRAELQKLNSQYLALENKSSERDTSQLEVATSLNQLEMSVQVLMEKVERMQGSAKKVSVNTPQTPTQ